MLYVFYYGHKLERFGIDKRKCTFESATNVIEDFVNETAEEQVSALADTSEGDTLGIYYLENTLKEISNLDSMVTQMSRAWKTGDDSLMVQVLNSGKKAEPSAAVAERVVRAREIQIPEKTARSRKNRIRFVVVGTAHLVLDENNVIELLRREGFKVERY